MYNQETKSKLAVVYHKGLNIYALLNRFKKEMFKDMPENIVNIVCDKYLSSPEKVINPWGWFLRVLRAERDKSNAKVNVLRGEETKKLMANVKLLKEIFK
jgi:hypothetical protein